MIPMHRYIIGKQIMGTIITQEDPNKQEQKAKNKNKIGLPPNKRYRLTPLARHKISTMLTRKIIIETQKEHHETCDKHI